MELWPAWERLYVAVQLHGIFIISSMVFLLSPPWYFYYYQLHGIIIIYSLII